MLKIIFRNLARETTQQQIEALFAGHGRVQSCTLVMDEVSGQSKGFGFVNMPVPAEAKAAIKGMNGLDLDGARIRVKKAVEDAGVKPSASQEQSPESSVQTPSTSGKTANGRPQKKDGSVLGSKKPRVFKNKR